MSEEFKPGTEAFRSVKGKINQEGWEQDDDGEGQAAVFIGTKEEAEAARKKLESKEATFADLRSYLAVNSVKVAEAGEIQAYIDDPEDNDPYKADIWETLKPGSYGWTDTKNDTLLFKSNDGSLKKCIVNDLERISEFIALPKNKQERAFDKSIEKMGFVFSGIFPSIFEKSFMAYRERNLQKEKTEQRFEF